MNSPTVVITYPRTLPRQEWTEQDPLTLPTSAAFERLFARARRWLKILSPYVDPTFAGLVHKTKAPIRILTLPLRGDRANPVVERCALTRPGVFARYLKHAPLGGFSLHAKVVIADGEIAYVGSAHLTDTSLHYNMELGLLVDSPPAVSAVERMFDHLYDDLAVPAGALKRSHL